MFLWTGASDEFEENATVVMHKAADISTPSSSHHWEKDRVEFEDEEAEPRAKTMLTAGLPKPIEVGNDSEAESEEDV